MIYKIMQAKQVLLASFAAVFLLFNAAAQGHDIEANGVTSKAANLRLAENVSEPADEKQGVTDSEILIGSCISLSGTLQERGQQTTAGANSYLKYINDQGGVNGRKIVLSTCDDKYDPDEAIDCFKFCLKNKVFAGAFFIGSAPTAKYVRMAQASKTPMLGFCTGTPALYDFHPTEFALRASYADETHAIAKELTKNRQLKKIALIYQNDAYGSAIRETLIKDLAEYKISLVAEEPYDRRTSKIDQALAKVKESKPEVLILGATSDALISILKRCHAQGWAPLLVTVSTSTDYLFKCPNESEGVVVSQVVPDMNPRWPTVILYNKLRKKYYPSLQPNLSAFEGFLNAMVLVEGLKRAGKDLTRDKFVHALETIHDYDLGVGPNFKVNYSHNYHNGFSNNSVYFAIMHNGKLIEATQSDWNRILKKKV